MEAIELVFSLFPPFLLLSSGWSIKKIFFKEIDGYAASFLISLLLGSAAFVVPFVIIGSTTSMLRPFVIVHTLIVLLLLVFLRRQIVVEAKRFIRFLANARMSNDFLRGFACFSFVVYSIKAAISCLLGPIVSGDSLYFWISMGKVFYNTNSIPVFDIYHFWNYSAEPLSSSLYSWGYFIFGSTTLEVFRGIPILFFIGLPILSYEIACAWSGDAKAGQIALILFCFIPISDYMVYIYSFYADTMAIFFAIAAILLARKSIRGKSKYLGFLAGLSIAMALLTKYHIGLVGGAIIVIQFLSFYEASRWRKLIIAALTGLVAILMTIAGNMIWSFLSNPLSYVILGVLFLIIIWLRANDDYETVKSLNIKVGLFVSFIIGVSSSLVWGIRTLLQGASLFGVSFIRLLPISEQDAAISSIIGEVFQTSGTASRFTPLTLLGFVFHPLMNGFFSLAILVILISAAVKRKNLSLLWILLFWYVAYLTIMGYFSSGRQLLPCAVFLGPVLGIALTELSKDETSWWHGISLFLITAVFAITSIPQMVTSGLAANAMGVTAIPVISTFGIPYTTSFGLYTTPELVARIAIIAYLILAFLAIIYLYNGLLNLKYVIRNTKIIAVLSIILSVTLIAPMGMYAMATTSGNILSFDIDGSWNRGDYILADYMSGIVTSSDILLTFGDVVLSFKGYRVLDLYHNGLYSIPEIVLSNNISEIYDKLWSFGIRFLILPDNSSYLASSYWRLISYIPFPEQIANSNASVLVREMSHWRIFELVEPKSL